MNKMEKAAAAGTALGIVESIVELACGIFGIYSFFFAGTTAFITCGIILAVLSIVQMFLAGQSPTTAIIAIIAGGIIVKPFIAGAAIGLCIEATIMMTVGLLFMAIAAKNK